MPLLLIVSVLTTAYGGWPFDLVLLLVPVIQIAARLQFGQPGQLKVLATAFNICVGLVAALQLYLGVEYFWFIWMCPVLLLGYVGFSVALAKVQPALPSA